MDHLPRIYVLDDVLWGDQVLNTLDSRPKSKWSYGTGSQYFRTLALQGRGEKLSEDEMLRRMPAPATNANLRDCAGAWNARLGREPRRKSDPYTLPTTLSIDCWDLVDLEERARCEIDPARALAYLKKAIDLHLEGLRFFNLRQTVSNGALATGRLAQEQGRRPDDPITKESFAGRIESLYELLSSIVLNYSWLLFAVGDSTKSMEMLRWATNNGDSGAPTACHLATDQRLWLLRLSFANYLDKQSRGNDHQRTVILEYSSLPANLKASVPTHLIYPSDQHLLNDLTSGFLYGPSSPGMDLRRFACWPSLEAEPRWSSQFIALQPPTYLSDRIETKFKVLKTTARKDAGLDALYVQDVLALAAASKLRVVSPEVPCQVLVRAILDAETDLRPAMYAVWGTKQQIPDARILVRNALKKSLLNTSNGGAVSALCDLLAEENLNDRMFIERSEIALRDALNQTNSVVQDMVDSLVRLNRQGQRQIRNIDSFTRDQAVGF